MKRTEARQKEIEERALLMIKRFTHRKLTRMRAKKELEEKLGRKANE